MCMANQPMQHVIYLYNYAGQPWKAQYWAREIMDKLYNPSPAGYCGDEDTGQTSAWYIFFQHWASTRLHREQTSISWVLLYLRK